MKHHLELVSAERRPPKPCSSQNSHFVSPPWWRGGRVRVTAKIKVITECLKKIGWQLSGTYFFQSLLLRTLDGSLHLSMFNKVGPAISSLL